MRPSIAVGAIVVIALLAIVRADETDPPAAPIRLQEVLDRGIEGRLGVRLGTIVRISGTVVADPYVRKQGPDEPFMLEVATIDGRKLDQPVLYAFRTRGSGTPKPPKIGDRFAYVAYETGAFEGVPQLPFDQPARSQARGFWFVPQLIVVSK